jgi:hypothetical protein
MTKKNAKGLLLKYQAGTITEEERYIVESWMLHGAPSDLDLPDEELIHDLAEIRQRLENKGAAVQTKHLWSAIFAAASILLFLSFGVYLLLHKNPPPQQIAKNQIHDVAPGGNKAILTLANGKQIVLTGTQNGALAKQGSITINKTRDGQVVYTGASIASQNSQLMTYNSMQTPRGGQYHLTLADGTNVWLNAASSIRYPVAFTGNERRVEITGEAYFEVEHNATKPFRVICNGQTVEDLGTHFNINAYSDENSVKTTLLEGSVNVSSAGKSQTLKPGEQGQLEHGNIRIVDVDANDAIAWKNGFFQFKDDNLKDIMRQLGRWYDVDIKYEGKLPDREFSGDISRNIKLAQLLDMLGFEKIHFRIEGKTIIVTP